MRVLELKYIVRRGLGNTRPDPGLCCYVGCTLSKDLTAGYQLLFISRLRLVVAAAPRFAFFFNEYNCLGVFFFQ